MPPLRHDIHFLLAVLRNDAVFQEQLSNGNKPFLEIVLDFFLGGKILAPESSHLSPALKAFNPRPI